MLDHRMNVLFLIPQCPADHNWAGNRNFPSYLGPVKELLKLYADSTDRQHAYLFGASMGGSGVWRMLNECPNTFAAPSFQILFNGPCRVWKYDVRMVKMKVR
jgi:predicted peptidase